MSIYGVLLEGYCSDESIDNEDREYSSNKLDNSQDFVTKTEDEKQYEKWEKER